MDHLSNFINNKEILEYTQDFTHTVVHFTPLEILKLEEYTKLMQLFPVSTKHLIINEGVLTDAHEAVHRMQTKLNMVDPELFPLFKVHEKMELKLPIANLLGETGLKIGLRGAVLVGR